MPESADDRLDRYLAGELTRSEQRDLAQAALGDPELFDALTAAALVKATVLRSSGSDRATPVRRFRDSHVALALAGVAAIAAMVSLLMVYRPPSSSTPTPPTASSASSASSTPARTGAADSPRAASLPILLTARLDEAAKQPTATFRNDG